jgi:hypothetical protein
LADLLADVGFARLPGRFALSARNRPYAGEMQRDGLLRGAARTKTAARGFLQSGRIKNLATMTNVP